MPGIKELEHFREELSKLGNEREVTEERGETYEPFPPPAAIVDSIPTIDVDDLLASIDEGPSASSAEDITASVPEAPEVPHAAELSEFDSILESLQLDGDASPADFTDTSEPSNIDDFDPPEILNEDIPTDDVAE
ncbi:MAG TPA: hypothetical protein GXZ47_04075, partial [Treponema sp.]|nr:hypothetical protein [Treponema sp.]